MKAGPDSSPTLTITRPWQEMAKPEMREAFPHETELPPAPLHQVFLLIKNGAEAYSAMYQHWQWAMPMSR